MRLPSIKQLRWLLVGSFLGIVLIMMVVAETPQQEEEGLFGQLTLKEEASTPTKHKSNYQRIKEQGQQKKNTLRYKTKKTKEPPFFSFYREEQKQQQQEKPKGSAKKPQQPHKKISLVSPIQTL